MLKFYLPLPPPHPPADAASPHPIAAASLRVFRRPMHGGTDRSAGAAFPCLGTARLNARASLARSSPGGSLRLVRHSSRWIPRTGGARVTVCWMAGSARTLAEGCKRPGAGSSMLEKAAPVIEPPPDAGAAWPAAEGGRSCNSCTSWCRSRARACPRPQRAGVQVPPARRHGSICRRRLSVQGGRPPERTPQRGMRSPPPAQGRAGQGHRGDGGGDPGPDPCRGGGPDGRPRGAPGGGRYANSWTRYPGRVAPYRS